MANTVDTLLKEQRLFTPFKKFQSKANIQDPSIYEKARKNPLAFWDEWAHKLEWFKKWVKTLDWSHPPFAKWFVSGKLNASYNCLDRHIKTGQGDKLAFIWQGEPDEGKQLTYNDVYNEVNRLANVIKSLGIKKGDRVAIYLPMIPEAVYAMLACARIGAIHTVVFGGFSADSLKERINDAQAKLLITADGGYRRGKIVSLKETSDKAVEGCPSIQNILVVKRTGESIPFKQSRDRWYHELMPKADKFCEPEPMDSEDILFILYTSGTTGKPKGIIHTTGGYMKIGRASCRERV